jgi:hypothetical protein
MMANDYALVHSLPGRIRFMARHRQAPSVRNLGPGLAELPGVEQVRINPVINSLLIHYDPKQTDQAAILTYMADGTAGNAGGFRNKSVHGADDMFWSVLAGGMLLLSYFGRIHCPPNDYRKKYLDYLAAVAIGYSVMNHTGFRQYGNRTQHLDTLAGLISMFAIKGENAFLGMFVTWLFNFIEIMFGWPGRRPGASMALLKQTRGR